MNNNVILFIAIFSLLLIGLACDKDVTTDTIVEPDREMPSFDFDIPMKLEGDDTYYVAVETMPEIIGGIVSIQERIRYPELAKRAGIEGTVFIYAFIDAGGTVVKTEIVNDPGGGLGEAAASAVKEAKFKPGERHGQPVPVRVSIPVMFRLAS